MLRSRRIAIDIATIGMMEYYLAQVMHGFIAFARRHTNWRLIYNEQSLSLKNRFNSYDDLKRLKADAIIFSYHSHWTESDMKKLQSLGLPMLSISSMFSGTTLPLARVATDDYAIGQMVAEYFVGRGYRHFAYYGDHVMPWEEARQRGFQEYLAEREIPLLTCGYSDFFTIKREAQRLEGWLQKLPKPLAMMGGTDARALHILEACHDLNIRVPQDIAIVGVDNNPLICDAQLPSLSSVEQDTEGVGRRAGEILGEMLEAGEQYDTRILLPPKRIITRMSSDVVAVDDEALSRALLFIRDEAQNPIDVNHIVEYAGVSRRSLERRFKTRIGSSINEHLRRRRIEKAKHLLLETSLSLEEVAESSGFRRATYLCRIFKEMEGTTPRSWRDQFTRR